MKRPVCCFLLVFLVASGVVAATVPDSNACEAGDVDCDGTACTVFDIVAAIDRALSVAPWSCEADVDCDDTNDVFDVLCLIDCALEIPGNCVAGGCAPTGVLPPACAPTLIVTALDNPPVTGSAATGLCSISGIPCLGDDDCPAGESCVLDPGGGGCQVTEWTATLENQAGSSSPFDDVVVESLEIAYDWSVPGFDTADIVLPLGVTVPAGGTAQVSFFPISAQALSELGQLGGGATATLDLRFQGMTLSGVRISATATAPLFVEDCFAGLMARFVPDTPNPGPSTVAMVESSASGAIVVVDVDINEVDDLFGAAFEVIYDAAGVEFLGWAPGTALEAGGTTVLYQVDGPPGALTIGATRTGATGVDVPGSATLIELGFRLVSAGSSVVTFNGGILLSPGGPPEPIPGIVWHGGTFVAN